MPQGCSGRCSARPPADSGSPAAIAAAGFAGRCSEGSWYSPRDGRQGSAGCPAKPVPWPTHRMHRPEQTGRQAAGQPTCCRRPWCPDWTGQSPDSGCRYRRRGWPDRRRCCFQRSGSTALPFARCYPTSPSRRLPSPTAAGPRDRHSTGRHTTGRACCLRRSSAGKTTGTRSGETQVVPSWWWSSCSWVRCCRPYSCPS